MLCLGRDILPVFRLCLAGDVLDHGIDFALGDPGALHPNRLGCAHREEQRISLADELIGARLVENDP